MPDEPAAPKKAARPRKTTVPPAEVPSRVPTMTLSIEMLPAPGKHHQPPVIIECDDFRVEGNVLSVIGVVSIDGHPTIDGVSKHYPLHQIIAWLQVHHD